MEVTTMQVQMWKHGNHRIVVPYDASVLVRLNPKEVHFNRDGHLSVATCDPVSEEATQGLTDLKAYFRLCLQIELRIEDVRKADGVEGVRKFLAEAGWELEG